MSQMTLEELREELKNEISPANVTDARLNRWINWAYQDICTTFPFQETLTVNTTDCVSVADTRVYSIADDWSISDLRTVISMHDSTNNKWVEQTYIRKIDGIRNTTSGEPDKFLHWGGNIEFNIPTDDVYTYYLRYQKVVAALTTGQAHILPLDWEEGLVMLAAWKAFRAMKEYERANQIREHYKSFYRHKNFPTMEEFKNMDIHLEAELD